MSGVYCYFGVTTSGKTTLALDHLVEDIRRDGRPALVLDCMPAKNLKHYPHCRTLAQVVDQLYRVKTHAFYTPQSKEELDQLLKAVHAAATVKENPEKNIRPEPIHILWDEASIHQTTQSIPKHVEQAVRGWQHNECTFRIVSQRPADLHGVIFATMPEVYCFRLERQADLDRVRDELRLNPAEIETLNQGEKRVYSRDRFKTVKEQQHGTVGTGVGEDQTGHAHPVHPGPVREPAPPVAPALSQGVAHAGTGAGPEAPGKGP